jgi:hypothetical protein
MNASVILPAVMLANLPDFSMRLVRFEVKAAPVTDIQTFSVTFAPNQLYYARTVQML